MTTICPNCGWQYDTGKRKQRSTEISTRFHGHVTYVWRKLNEAGTEISRDEVYIRALLQACQLETVEGASPYPYLIIDGVLIPKRTTNRTNKEMMQACEGVRQFAANRGIFDLPEAKV